MIVQRFPSELGAFSDAVVVDGPGRWIHVAGQLGLDRCGALIEGDIYLETTAALSRLGRALNQAGAKRSDVVRIVAYLTDLGRFEEFNRARADYFGDALPASTAVQVAGLLLGAAVEIDAVAFVGGGE